MTCPDPHRAGAQPRAEGAILEVRDVSRSFGGVHALQAVSFGVVRHEVRAVIGPNGAGKTTLFNIVAGEIPPTHGTIVFEGREVHRLPAHRIARLGIARTFQTLRLFTNLSALENVMVGRHPRTRSGMIAGAARWPSAQREERAIRAAALDAMDRLGIAALAGRPVGALTFSEQRLLEIARALATEPRLLLLDEPAAGLNIAETEALGARILALRNGGITILLVEHDMSLVMDISDRVVVLDSGAVIAEDAPAEVQKNPRVVEAYLGRPGEAHAARPEP